MVKLPVTNHVPNLSTRNTKASSFHTGSNFAWPRTSPGKISTSMMWTSLSSSGPASLVPHCRMRPRRNRWSSRRYVLGVLKSTEGVLSPFKGMLTIFSIQLQAWLWDYRNRIKAKAEHVVLERFKKMHGDNADAIQDREKRIEFGTKWCDPNGKDYRFIWQGYDKSPVSRADCVFSPPSHDFDNRESEQASSQVLA
jgi:hypothetical protein